MKAYQFVQMDVFCTRSGAGNTLAVVIDADGLDDATMQSIARWTRLAETTYTFPPSDDSTPKESSYGIRMFSPTAEVPFAGHPSVGTAKALIEAGLITPDAEGLVWQHGKAGVIPLRISGDGVQQTAAVRAPQAQVVEDATARFGTALNAASANLAPGSIPPALMDGGRRWWVVEAESEAALRAWVPAWNGIAALASASESMGICAYAFADDATADYQIVTRALVGAGTQFEDAASGAANATLAAYLFDVAANRLAANQYTVSQGREVGFDAQLIMTRDPQGQIWSGGQTRTVVRGTLQWNADA